MVKRLNDLQGKILINLFALLEVHTDNIDFIFLEMPIQLSAQMQPSRNWQHRDLRSVSRRRSAAWTMSWMVSSLRLICVWGWWVKGESSWGRLGESSGFHRHGKSTKVARHFV